MSPSIRTNKANLGHITREITCTNWLSPIKLCVELGVGILSLEQNQDSISKKEWRVDNWVGSQQSSPHLKKFFLMVQKIVVHCLKYLKNKA